MSNDMMEWCDKGIKSLCNIDQDTQDKDVRKVTRLVAPVAVK